jgi:ammonium transporter, Amt family
VHGNPPGEVLQAARVVVVQVTDGDSTDAVRPDPGLLATTAVNAHGADGLLYGGGLGQLWRQAVAILATIAYSGGATFGIALLIHKTIGLRVAGEAERDGIDEAEHAETAYEMGAVRGHRAATVSAARPADLAGHDRG